MTKQTTLQPFRIPSKLTRLKMVVAYARVMESLRQAAKAEDASERPKKRKVKKR